MPVFRISLPELFEVFDFANPSLVTGRRDVSTVAPQALYMMNHEFVRSQSRLAAARLLRDVQRSTSDRIDHAYLLTLGRHATEAEVTLSQQFVKSVSDRPGTPRIDAWAQMVQSMFSSVQFRYVR